MAIYTRENEYIKLLEARDHTVKELSDKLFISEPTVRRDIILMKEKDLVVCKRGLVSLKKNSASKRIPLPIRDLENKEKKELIAAKAIHFINDGDVIMLDASTTAQYLLPHLAKLKNIFVITNGAKTAIELAAFGIKTVCCGGEITNESLSYIGPDAEGTLKKYHADIAFFSCRGIDESGVVSDNSILENSVRRVMMENADKKILLCDSSKIGHRYLNMLCNTTELDAVICDTKIEK